MSKASIAKAVHLVDALLVVNLPRSVLAILAYWRDGCWQTYTKVRQMSVYFFWPALAMLQFFRIYTVIFLESSVEISSGTYIRELLLVLLIFVSALVDKHLCKYIFWEGSRREKERNEAEKS